MSPKFNVRSPELPFIFSNFAMTADGKIAFSTENFVPFSCERDREHMMELRATADAILCGARTVEVTETVLGTGGEKFRKQRLKKGVAEFPLRIVASGEGSINPKSNIFKKRFSPIVILTTKRISGTKLKLLRAVADEVKIFGEGEIDFRAALCWLRTQWNIKRLLCEGGGELHDALVRGDLVNELHLTICPKIFGGRGAPTIAEGQGALKLLDAAGFRLKSLKRMNNELFTVFERAKNLQFHGIMQVTNFCI